MHFVFKVQLISVFFYCEEILANNVPRFNRASTVPPNLSLYKYEGNFYPAFASNNVNLNEFQGYSQQKANIRYLMPVELSHQIYHDEDRAHYGPTDSDYQVAIKVQPLQQVSSSKKHVESGISEERNLKLDPMIIEEKNSIDKQDSSPSKINSVTRHYHDIYLKLKSPQDLIFGHVLNWPELAEKKIEKRNENQYKGQVIWADRKGGYGEHYWDLAQGAL